MFVSALLLRKTMIAIRSFLSVHHILEMSQRRALSVTVTKLFAAAFHDVVDASDMI